MGCCCLDHRPSQPYTTLARIDATTGDEVLTFDIMHPLIGDQNYSSFGMIVSAWVANGFVYQASVVSPDGLANTLLVTCCAVDSNATIWVSKETSSATNVRLYADSSYVWVVDENGGGWCFAASDGDLVSSTTGLDTNAYDHLTAGYNNGTIFLGDYAEYDHEFTETQSNGLTTYNLAGLWDVGEWFVSWHVPGKVYRIYKSDLETETLIKNINSFDNALGASDTLFFIDAPNNWTAYNYSDVAQWNGSTSSARKFFGYGGGKLYCRSSGNKLTQIDPSDGSSNWTTTLIAPQPVPRRTLYDGTNSQFYMSQRAFSESTGSINWTTGRAWQEIYNPGDGYLYITYARQTA